MKKVKIFYCFMFFILFSIAIPFKAEASFAWDRCCFQWYSQQLGFIEIMDCWYLGGSCPSFGDCSGCY